VRTIVAILSLGLVLVAGTPVRAGDARPSPAPAPAPDGAAPATTPAVATAPDTIDEALAASGLTRADLGWRARGWWDRYPIDVPYRLRHVEDLFADPLATIPWLRAMGTEVATLLAAEGLAKKGELGAGPLYRLVHDLGVHRRFGGTRPYSANLTATPTPLAEALLAAWRETGRATRPVTFGKPADFPDVAKDLATATERVPADVSAIVGRLFLDLLVARRLVDRAWRRSPLEARAAVFARLDVGLEETDALDYEPAMDDLAATWDEASRWVGGLKVVAALDVARLALAALPATSREGLGASRVDVETPVGRVILLGAGDDALDVGSEGAFLVVDLGGNDRYRGSLGASSLTRGVGAMLDLAGDDAYDARDRALGCGIVGVGVLLDATGNDVYAQTGTLGEGAGQFGLGVLADLGGDDRYAIAYSGQGCGFFGVGVLLDAAGEDRYALWSDGQGFGGVAGVGVLADGALRSLRVRADPRSRDACQHFGRAAPLRLQRPGLLDGPPRRRRRRSLMGGRTRRAARRRRERHVLRRELGAGHGLLVRHGRPLGRRRQRRIRRRLVELRVGRALLLGARGRGCDDLHRVTQNWGPGYGHDFTVGIACDLAGNDRYECAVGCGHSINRSVGMLLDGQGDDVYAITTAGGRPGMAPLDPRILDRSGKTSLYWTESTSLGLFVDAGGKDLYPEGFADDGTHVDPPGSDAVRGRHFGIAVDRAAGRLDVARPSGRR
jgi:hypothetical protein